MSVFWKGLEFPDIKEMLKEGKVDDAKNAY
jgi:hypothetical protein